MQPFDAEFIREQRELAEKATPRPWNFQSGETYTEPDGTIAYESPARCKELFTIDMDEFMGMSNENAEYAISAANNYPLALAEIERLQAEVERLKAENEWELVRVPDNTDDVLAVDDLGVVFIATYIPETGKWYDNDGELSTKGECPIGWRKLPAAPRSEK